MRYVVSDVHGCLDNLLDVLKQAEFNEEKDILYILGDIVDRGPQTWETYLWVKERINKCVYMITGNHEDMLMTDVFILKGSEIMDNHTKVTEENKKYVDYLKRYMYASDQYHTILWLARQGHSIDELVEMCEFFEKLPLYYEVDIYGKVYTLVHAYCKENIEETERSDIFWERCFAEDKSIFCHGKTVIFGHTPLILIGRPPEVEHLISKDKKSEKFNIDCGCVYGGRLALMRLEDEMIFYSDYQRGF